MDATSYVLIYGIIPLVLLYLLILSKLAPFSYAILAVLGLGYVKGLDRFASR